MTHLNPTPAPGQEQPPAPDELFTGGDNPQPADRDRREALLTEIANILRATGDLPAAGNNYRRGQHGQA